MTFKSNLTEVDEYEMLKLKLRGLSQREIAARYNVSDATVSRVLKRQLSVYRENNMHEINELVSIEEGRLDEMYKALQPKIEKGDSRAIEAGIKISERRAKLLDLDAAQKLELSGSLVQFINEDMGE